ncbi:hypothetical protein HMPREF1868_01979 [Olsenella sp. DNF00959]|nr:hypothetical protein HMPREF1868_01979 [Olsenella sp. DNF00959]
MRSLLTTVLMADAHLDGECQNEQLGIVHQARGAPFAAGRDDRVEAWWRPGLGGSSGTTATAAPDGQARDTRARRPRGPPP